MRGTHDPRRAMHIHSHVLRRIQARLTRVDTRPDPSRPTIELPHQLAHSTDSRRGRREGVEEGVTFVVDLVAVEARACRAHDAAVLRERLAVGVGAELLEQPSGSLDVGEHHRHRSRQAAPPLSQPDPLSARSHSQGGATIDRRLPVRMLGSFTTPSSDPFGAAHLGARDVLRADGLRSRSSASSAI